jgi:DHA1 family bicyclomycin/chloramphenicol resistance-like MFS transporter|uniref:Bcr/CflA family efflux transporter n=1 Tax=Acidicaldus sp. TaxID=1872105 RepID=A0A8J4H8P5_9PROT
MTEAVDRRRLSGANPPFWLTLLLGVLTAVGPLSTDMYLPAFPRIEADLGGIAGGAQMTLAAWFVGLAIGQITQGSLSDRFGRRAPLLFGTALYALASLGCALAPGLWLFSACRTLAAIGGSASMVIPRAMVRDLADGHEAARLLSRLMLVMGVVPILAPAAGGAVLVVAGWRVIFWIATLYGAVCMVLVWYFLPDTLPENRRIRLGPVGLLGRYASIAREPRFFTHALCGGLALAGLFAYLGGSPVAFIGQYHIAPAPYGMLFGLNAAGFIFAAQVNARLLPRFGTDRVIRVSARAAFLATAVLTLDAFTGWGGVAGLAAPLFCYLGSLGFLMPNTTVGALSRHAAQAASASALMGTGQFVLGAISGTLVGLLSDGTARPMALLMLAGGTGVLLTDRLRARAARALA